jgi:hypothetical protein
MLVCDPRAPAQSLGELVAETCYLTRQRGADFRARENVLQRLFECRALHQLASQCQGELPAFIAGNPSLEFRALANPIDELIEPIRVEALVCSGLDHALGDPLDDVMLDQRPADRLGQRPGEGGVDCTLGLARDHAAPRPGGGANGAEREAIEPHAAPSKARKIFGPTAQSREPVPGAGSPSTRTTATPPFFNVSRKLSLPPHRIDASVDRWGSWPTSATDFS